MNDQLELVNVQEENKLDILLDSSYPLLQRLREEAPGTYKHSQALESMIEGVSMDIGLDVTSMRVVALYHDIGKIFNPEFFCENALDDKEDLHDNLDPWVSTQIITRHVSDSVNILINDSNFPRDLVSVISQHHGTTRVNYFFEKSKKK